MLEVPKPGTKVGTSHAWVLEAHKREDGSIIVLLLTPRTVQPFATGILTSPDAWLSGHYFDNVNEALTDFLERT